MTKLLLTFLAACLGSTGFILLRQPAEEARAATAQIEQQLQSGRRDLSTNQDAISSLTEEVHAKQRRLHELSRHPNISHELLSLLEGNTTNAHAAAWAELRQELGIGWNSSPDYVLVNKQALKDVWYSKLYGDNALSDDSVALLGLTSAEQAALKTALDRARQGQWLNVQSTPPAGDVVAQLTITPPDPSWIQTQSNNFAADVTAAIGSERAGLFLPDAWYNFTSTLAPSSQPETLTIRQVTVDGQPDLVCEETHDGTTGTMPVRYAHYPYFPVMKLFPGGWQNMAQSLGFTLPPSFMSQANSQ